MILLAPIARSILNEILTYDELIKYTDNARIARGKKMNTRSAKVEAYKNGESWNFKCTSDKSHATLRQPQTINVAGRPYVKKIATHNTRISFLKEITTRDNARKTPCRVDCTCEDYRYQHAYANNAHDAGDMGKESLNKCNGQFPSRTNNNLRPGLCKHLVSLRDYIRTKLEESQQPTLSEKLDDVVSRYPTATLELIE